MFVASNTLQQHENTGHRTQFLINQFIGEHFFDFRSTLIFLGKHFGIYPILKQNFIVMNVNILIEKILITLSL